MDTTCTLIVSERDDLIASVVKDQLTTWGDTVIEVRPGNLCGLPTRMRDGKFWIEGYRVNSILFRASSDGTFSDDFDTVDRLFCDAEARSVWLAAIQLNSIYSINRYDATAWFEGAYWPTWRRHLISKGIAVSSFSFGSVAQTGWWYPYRSTKFHSLPSRVTSKVFGVAISDKLPIQHSLIVAHEVLVGDSNPNLVAASNLLSQLGIQFAEVICDSDERVLMINSQPFITDHALAALVGSRLAKLYHDNMHCR